MPNWNPGPPLFILLLLTAVILVVVGVARLINRRH